MGHPLRVPHILWRQGEKALAASPSRDCAPAQSRTPRQGAGRASCAKRSRRKKPPFRRGGAVRHPSHCKLTRQFLDSAIFAYTILFSLLRSPRSSLRMDPPRSDPATAGVVRLRSRRLPHLTIHPWHKGGFPPCEFPIGAPCEMRSEAYVYRSPVRASTLIVRAAAER